MIKHCPQCGSTELEFEPSSETSDEIWYGKKRLDAISYVCQECMAEFIGISSKGIFITYEGIKEYEGIKPCDVSVHFLSCEDEDEI